MPGGGDATGFQLQGQPDLFSTSLPHLYNMVDDGAIADAALLTRVKERFYSDKK